MSLILLYAFNLFVSYWCLGCLLGGCCWLVGWLWVVNDVVAGGYFIMYVMVLDSLLVTVVGLCFVVAFWCMFLVVCCLG